MLTVEGRSDIDDLFLVMEEKSNEPRYLRLSHMTVPLSRLSYRGVASLMCEAVNCSREVVKYEEGYLITRRHVVCN